MIGVSQGTLSELEQDKYKPALGTIMEIHNKFKTDIYWLATGEEQSQHFEISKRLGETETEFILQFRKLKLEDQDEILEFIKLKINRYDKKR